MPFSSGKSEKSLIYAKKANLLARKYAILRKSILLPKSMPIIAKRFNYAELYQADGHYTSNNLTVDTTKIP